MFYIHMQTYIIAHVCETWITIKIMLYIYIYPIPPGPSSKVYPPKAKHVGIFLVISSIYFFCWTLVGLMPRLSRGSSGSSHSEITVRAWAVSLLKRIQPLGKSPTTSNNIPGFGWCMGMYKVFCIRVCICWGCAVPGLPRKNMHALATLTTFW